MHLFERTNTIRFFVVAFIIVEKLRRWWTSEWSAFWIRNLFECPLFVDYNSWPTPRFGSTLQIPHKFKILAVKSSWMNPKIPDVHLDFAFVDHSRIWNAAFHMKSFHTYVWLLSRKRSSSFFRHRNSFSKHSSICWKILESILESRISIPVLS